jgi:hypothetical protein
VAQVARDRRLVLGVAFDAGHSPARAGRGGVAPSTVRLRTWFARWRTR